MAIATLSLESAREALQEAEAQDVFWREHHDELLAEYPEHFVAVSRDRFVAADADLLGLVQVIKDAGQDLQSVSIRFLTKDRRRLML